MSLYNMLFGENVGVADIALATLGLSRGDVGRYRDCWLEDGKIVVHTRNGGGNREHWDGDVEDGESCHCTGCTITYHIPKHPDYLRDTDDDFDCTYADVEYRWPEQHRELLTELFAAQGQIPKASERWTALLTALAAPPSPAVGDGKDVSGGE